MKRNLLFDLQERHILDSLNDGVYVTDTERKIIFWNSAAERTTGWNASEVIGKRCSDNILCHVDKDSHKLCGEEHCPLHRSIITGHSSTFPIMVFAKAKDGSYIPMQVSVAPIRDASGKIIGGVETFRDVSTVMRDLERAKQIQSLSLREKIIDDPRITISTHYVPRDIIRGDYYTVEQLDNERCVFILADVMGHGIASALYTMHLYSLWEESRGLLGRPVSFIEEINHKLCKLVRDDESYATCIYGLLDMDKRLVTLCSAGSPPLLLIRNNGECEARTLPGLPLGLIERHTYDEVSIQLDKGDSLLFYTDGAVEVFDANGRQLGTTGLLNMVKELGYPDSGKKMERLEEDLLKFSNQIRLDDDLTFLGIHFVADTK